LPVVTEAEWLERAARYCFQGRLDRRQTEGPVFSHGSGSVVVDVEGKEYLDFNSGQMCSALGHGHPRIVAAVAEALRTLIHANSTYYNVQEIALAERLGETLPAPLRKSFFALSGSDSNEAAIGIAKKVTGRYEIASPHVSFHGLSDTPRAVTYAGWRRGLAPPAAGSFAMLAPYCFRCPVRHTFPSCELACLDASFELLDAETADGLAGVITEPLFSAGGVIEPPPGWLAQVAADARARGALFILDEAQTGLAKLGTMWALEQEGVVPDIVTVSKHFGGGIAISAVVTTEEIEEEAIRNGYSYAHSHSNDPLACAAALATLEAIEEERLTERAVEIGSRLRAALEDLRARHEAIGDIRGRGILQGFELIRADGSPAVELGEAIRRSSLRDGLIFSVRRGGSVLRFVPPFSTTAEQIDRAGEILDTALTEATATVGTPA
jgi:2,2-dialkylglycine decarboxylase (pyruvate)